MKISQLRSEFVDEGTLVDLPDWPGIKVSVRASDHPEYQNALTVGFERKRRATKDPTVRNEIVYRAIAKHLLFGWEGVTDDDEKPLEFDRELVVGWAKDRAYRRFFESVLAAASLLASEVIEEREDQGKS